MKLFTCRYQGEELVCALSADGKSALPVKKMGLPYASMTQLIEYATDDILDLMRGCVKNGCEGAVALTEAEMLAPIPYPKQDVICMGLNYMEHTREVAEMHHLDKPEERVYPIYFGKHVDRARGDGESIPSHAEFISTLDYECELGVVIRRDIFRIRPEDVRKAVFGYTIIDDISGRELNRHKQNFFQKSLDGACPMGPWIVTADEFEPHGFPPKVRIQTWVNGEKRQDGSSENMIFNIDELVSEISQGITIKAGSIFATGSPKGIGASMTPPQFLKAGDHIRHEIEGIGVLNTYVE